MGPVLRRGAAAALLGALLAGGSAAAETLADLRAQLTTLNGQVQQLRDELVRQGSAGGLPSAPATALVRLDQLEAELRRINGRVDVLTNDIDRIVRDASNQIGEIDFRLTELEGGDTSLIGRGEVLGGGVTAVSPRPRPSAQDGGAELTVTEQSDFDAAMAAVEAGDNAKAAELFGAFLATYPGGPLSNEAQFRRGEAQAALGDWQGAARSFLDAFSGAPNGPLGPPSLLQLGISLGQLGQATQACATLDEVIARYPGSGPAGEVAAAKASLNCA